MKNIISKDKSYICFNDLDTKKLQFLDEKFKGMALELGAVECHIPAMIDKSILSKCGYFDTFPQYLSVVAHADRSLYNQIIDDKSITDKNGTISEQYLTPAACLHIYPMLENTEVKNQVITTRARVYRYEDEQYDGKVRLWDFTVREIVFIGDVEYVRGGLDFIKQKTLEFTSKINLSVDIELAEDNFYYTAQNTMLKKIQRANCSKFELRTSLNEKDVALASFNSHNFHFSKTFNFDNDMKVVTGCVGFGLERWVNAINYNNIELDEKNEFQ